MAVPLAWSTLSSLGTQALSFLTFAILARLLGASAFGLVALAALVVDLLQAASNAGISEAVVQRPSLTEKDADTAFWLNLGSGVVFCALTVALAPTIAGLFDHQELTPLIMVLAGIFVITPLGAIHTARMARSLTFRAIAGRNLAAALAGTAVGIPLALGGYGAWALVGQRIATALILAASGWACLRWIPRCQFDRVAAAQMLRFGSWIGVAGTLNQINIRSAEIISGGLLGPLPVAFIRAGSRIVEVLNQVTYMPFQQIAVPVLARSADDLAVLRDTFQRLSRLSAFVMFPAFLGTLALAGPIVQLVLGRGWEAVADAVRIFGCAVVASQMNNLMVATITACGASRRVLSWTTAQIALGLLAAVAAAPWGWQAMLMTGVARGYLILPYGLHLLKRHAGIGAREVLASLRPALTSGLSMAAIVLAGVFATEPHLPSILVVGIWLPIGVLSYLCAYLWQDPDLIRQVCALLPWRRTASAPVARASPER
ncbi:lipopolysaccharide biosynthesis protein [Novosphingobium soli]|uniref:lipopolysaccharide biosynthesis protein n=1 Tax=Novosphingobium soli TaxID=574956 RepID=UPI0036D2A75B